MPVRPSISPELVEEQLERIQSSPLFSHSRRYPGFLSYVVRKTLEGCQDELKERTVGVEAFGRDANYDLNADPIVRVTAGEVRKRLAQYYYEPGRQSELRIELYPGSYVPEFRFDQPRVADSSATASAAVADVVFPTPATAPEPVDEKAPAVSSTTAASRRSSSVWVYAWALTATVLLLVVLSAYAWEQMKTTAVERFWQPVLDAHLPVTIAVGTVDSAAPRAEDSDDPNSVGGHPQSSDPVALSDAIAISNVQRVQVTHARPTTVQSANNITFSDMQKGPAVLISGFDNAWTMRLTEKLRFHLVRSTSDTFAIEDRANPSRRWSVNTLTKFTSSTRDYGLLARYFDPTTQQLTVVAAGIGENGTVAATQLLTEERFMKQLLSASSAPEAKQNFEAVVETEMIDGKPGPPRIVASHKW